MTSRHKPSSGIAVRRDSATGKRVTLITGTNATDPLKLAARLSGVLLAGQETPGSKLYFVTFPEAPQRTFKNILSTALEEGLRSAADEAGDEEGPGEDYWGNPRLEPPVRSGPSFTLVLIDGPWFCGFWLNRTTLVLGDLDTHSPPTGNCSMEASHWHPDSMTSGLWQDKYVVLGNGLDVAWSFKDEDGTYISFRRGGSSSAGAVAKRLGTAVTGWYIYGAEKHILTAYLMGFRGGTIALLRSDDNPGYAVDDVRLIVDADVEHELLRRNPLPSVEEATEWVRDIIAHVGPDLWAAYLADEYADEFLPALIAIAGTEA